MQPPPPPLPSSSARCLLSVGAVVADDSEHHDDELEYLSSATLTRRKEALAAGDAHAHAAPHRALYFRRNGDAARLFEAASRRLSREPNCIRALMIRASVLVKKGEGNGKKEEGGSGKNRKRSHGEN